MVIQGIIRPPPEIRVVADRTALFVSKNGRAFEQRILNSEKGKSPKFAFLLETSPFHNYYEDKIRFYEEGGKDEKVDERKEEKKEEEEAAAEDKGKNAEEEKKKSILETTSIKASAIDPIARALLSERANIKTFKEKLEAKRKDNTTEQQPQEPDVIPPPPPFLFASISAPSTASPAEIEIIKLAAQFTAFNHHNSVQYNTTSSFYKELSRLEWNNPTTFGFLQPRHAHFAYFTALVDVYRRLLSLSDESNGAPMRSVNSLLEPIYASILTTAEEKKQPYELQNQILHLAAYRVEYDRYEKQSQAQSTTDDDVNNNNLSAQSAYINWHDFVVVETIDFPVDEIVVPVTQVDENFIPPPPPPPPPLPKEEKPDDGMDMSESDDDIDVEKEHIHIDPNYQPRVKAQGQTSSNLTVIDPITKKAIPIANMEEHMRIQLLDPKWATERAKFLEKQKESNYVKGGDIAKNIGRFVDLKKRDEGDFNMFGSLTEEELANKEQESRKRLEEANRIILDQQVPSAVPPPPPPPPLPAKRSLESILPKPIQPQQPAYISTVVASSAPPAKKLIPANAFNDPIATTAVVPPPATTVASSATTTTIVPEDEFISSLPSPELNLKIKLPSSTQMLNFQSKPFIYVSIPVTSSIKLVKERISLEFNNSIPTNKIQIKFRGAFVKDALTLASVNCAGGEANFLEVLPKVRGGRK